MSSLDIHLDELLDCFEQLNLPVAQHLQPGLLVEHIAQLTTDLSFRLPDEVVQLYMWRNGSPTEGVCVNDITFFPNFYFLSLENALEDYKLFEDARLWYPGKLEEFWFPLFSNLARDIDLDECKRAIVSSPIISYSSDVIPSPDIYNSLNTMVTTLVECFESKAFYVEGDWLTSDLDKEITVARKHNPGNEYWENKQTFDSVAGFLKEHY